MESVFFSWEIPYQNLELASLDRSEELGTLGCTPLWEQLPGTQSGQAPQWSQLPPDPHLSFSFLTLSLCSLDPIPIPVCTCRHFHFQLLG